MAADVKCLEHPTLKVPYELLNKKFRAAQKNIDREVSRVQSATSELEKCLQRSASLNELTQALDSVADKLMLLKRKAEESIQDEIDAAKVCKRRVDHLREIESQVPAVAELWRKKRIDRMIVDHFLRAGYYTTAMKLAKHSHIEDLTNIELFIASREIEEALEKKDTSKCLAWCNENKSKLKKMKSTLEFRLRQQEFVELVRANGRIDAVRYARKYFVGLEENQYSDLQCCMGLLAFPADCNISPYKELLDPNRWHQLKLEFRQENFKLHQLSTESVFHVAAQAGLSALKTPQCYQNSSAAAAAGKENSSATVCPVCNPTLNELARRLPAAHCAQSRLICAISNLPLNEYNPPMVLPNGHVYGLNALLAMSTSNNGKIICPRTKDVFNFSEAEKVFVM